MILNALGFKEDKGSISVSGSSIIDLPFKTSSLYNLV